VVSVLPEHEFGGGVLQTVVAHGSMQLPAPSQMPPVPVHTVPATAYCVPHTPAMHVLWLQAVSVPGQSAATAHPAQLPFEQTVPAGQV
jgi:hypothetical protein